MSDIFVEIKNDSFKEVTVLKAHTQEKIVTLSPGDHKTFRLIDESHTVTICARLKGTATVELEGILDGSQIDVIASQAKELKDDESLPLNLAKPTRLTLLWEPPAANAVKCGEVIIEPPLAQ